ncbi:hypothetical protein [Amycolatopsis kentuckyensis]|uniref:hypothetical protein n=1 Tax=Amycolatopsis kentuckyensis TaxID=218823 RepID=UPI00356261BC
MTSTDTTATVEFTRNDMGDYVAQTAIGEFYLFRSGRMWDVELNGEAWDLFESRVHAQEAIVEEVEQAAANAAERADVEPVADVAPQLAPMVWEFYDTGAAYNASQSNDSIEDGAVLVAESDKVVGILIQAWPTAITTAYGAFHGYLTAAEFAGLDEERTEPIYAAAYAVALAEAEKRGWTVATDAFTVDAEPAAEELPAPAAAPDVAELGTAPELLPAHDGGLFGLALTEGTPETGFGFVATAPEPALALF